MASRKEQREALRQKLIEVTEARIAANGLGQLRARDLAEDAGCSVGAIYNAFDDMDDLVLRVNARTLAEIGALAKASTATTPRDRLRELALVYAGFALEHTNRWAALFDHRMSNDRSTPDWYRRENVVLIEEIARPAAALRPPADMAEVLVRARTLFSAVHGIVTISIENRFVGVAPTDLKAELSRFVDILATGIEATTPER